MSPDPSSATTPSNLAEITAALEKHGIVVKDVEAMIASETESLAQTSLAAGSRQDIERLIAEREERLQTLDPLALQLRPNLDGKIIPDLQSDLALLVNQVSDRLRELLTAKTASILAGARTTLANSRAHLAKQLREVKAELTYEAAVEQILRRNAPHAYGASGEDRDDATLFEAVALALDTGVATRWAALTRQANQIITIADELQLRKFTKQHGPPIAGKSRIIRKDIDELVCRGESYAKVTEIVEQLLQEQLATILALNALVVVSPPRLYLKREAYMLEAYLYQRHVILKDHEVWEPAAVLPPPAGLACSIPFATLPRRDTT